MCVQRIERLLYNRCLYVLRTMKHTIRGIDVQFYCVVGLREGRELLEYIVIYRGALRMHANVLAHSPSRL